MDPHAILVVVSSFGRSVDASPLDTPIEDPWLVPKPPPPKKAGRAIWPALVAGGIVLGGGGLTAAGLILLQPATPEPPPASSGPVLARDEVSRHSDVDKKQTQATPQPSAKAPPTPQTWRETREETVGALRVVDLGGDEPTLRGALQDQMKKAKAEKKEVLVLVMADNCDPCKKLKEALPEAAMQEALSPVVLVRVNALVFERELQDMNFRTNEKPGLYLLSSDGTPRDGITGAEWDDDTVANMSPVLKNFVRGTYPNKTRRHKFTLKGTVL